MMRILTRAVIVVVAMAALTGMPAVAGQRDYDCADFATQQEAQRYFESRGGSRFNNVDRLDGDRDGIACEALPRSRASSAPVQSRTTTAPATASIAATQDGWLSSDRLLGGAIVLGVIALLAKVNEKVRFTLGLLMMPFFGLLRLGAGLATIFAVINLVFFWNGSGFVQWMVIAVVLGVAQLVMGAIGGLLMTAEEA